MINRDFTLIPLGALDKFFFNVSSFYEYQSIYNKINYEKNYKTNRIRSYKNCKTSY